LSAGPADELKDWIAATFDHRPADLAPFERALTHGSQAAANYERLEFLGDRVLGLVMAEWLFMLFPAEPEGALSKRLNALVTGAVCADVARGLGVAGHLRLGKQALSRRRARCGARGDPQRLGGTGQDARVGAAAPQIRAAGMGSGA
jgi:dsRNA-specific ribonuclease